MFNEEQLKKMLKEIGEVEDQRIQKILKSFLLELTENNVKESREDIQSKEEVLNYVVDTLRNIGVPAHLKGYEYIRDAILLAFYDMSILGCITKKLYPYIAKKYNTEPYRVERAIRNAIEVSWGRGDRNLIDKIFGYTIDYTKGRPTNSEFIATICDNTRVTLKKYDF